jgi:hypothetical protein
MEVCRITLPADPATLSPNAVKKRRFREVLQLRRKAWMDARVCWQLAGRPVADGPVIVHLVVRRAREMDEDNIIAGLKNHRDGLFVGAITPDDKPKYVRLGHIEQQIKPEYKLKPEVVFIVETLE